MYLPDLFDGVRRRDQLLAVGGVDAVVAGVTGRGRGDQHMHFAGAGISDHLDDLAGGGAADDGVIDDHHPFPLEDLPHRVQLDLDAEVADRLLRFDEGPADIVIPDQPQFEADPGLLGIAHGRRHPGIGDRR